MYALLLFVQKQKADGHMHRHLHVLAEHIQKCFPLSPLIQYWWENKVVQAVWKAIWQHPSKLCTQMPSNPTIPLWGIYATVSCTRAG